VCSIPVINGIKKYAAETAPRYKYPTLQFDRITDKQSPMSMAS